MRFSFPLVIATTLAIGGAGCASSRMGDRVSDSLFRQQKYDEAATRLSEGLAKEGEDGRDGLLYLMDLGLALHSAGKYDESNKVLLRADKLAEIKDYTSLTTEASTLLTSDQIKQYKGEDFENVLINVYLAMNFACMGRTEDALIEARRVNRKLYLMVSEGKRKYKQNAFARYLSAILYEANSDWNDAYVDYKYTADLLPEFQGLGEDLWRMAYRLGMRDEMERWEKKYSLTPQQRERARALVARDRPAEIIVLYENGISPEKRPDPGFYSVPKFYPRPNPVSVAKVSVEAANGQGGKSRVALAEETRVLHDIESTAIQNLDEKWGGIVAKKAAGIFAKEAVGNAVASQTNEGWGALVKLALFASDQADTRSWNLLPKDLQIARFSVPPGTYTVRVSPVGAATLPERTIQVKRGQKVFTAFRYMP